MLLSKFIIIAPLWGTSWCSPPMEVDLGSEGGVQLARMDHSVFWPIQRKIERHGEEKKGLRKDSRAFGSGKH